MFPAPHFLPGQTGSGAWTTRLGPVSRGGAPGRARLRKPTPSVHTVASTHSWMSQSPAARAALLWALAAALQRREPSLVSRLERHGVELKVARVEVELSVKRLRAWGAGSGAQGCALQVRGSVGRQTRTEQSGVGSEQGSGKSRLGVQWLSGACWWDHQDNSFGKQFGTFLKS